MKRAISLILALTLALASAVPAAAADDATGTTLRLDETTGTVGVTDAAGVDKTIRAGMRLYNGYGVETGASSAAYITLDDTKAVKLDASGKAEIKKQGKKLEVALTSGQLYFNVTEPLKTDESLNIRTATMVTGIRGSFGWVSPDHMGLLHGHVTLTCTNPETGETRVTEVYSGELVRYEQNAQETEADPALLEIDFVKTEVTLAAIPAVVVEQVANDETLQAQLIEDVPALDVTELIESLPAKQAEEKAAEEKAQTQVEAAVAVQEQQIAAAAAADAVAQEKDDGAGQAYADLSSNTPTVAATDDSGSDDSDDSGDSGGTPATVAETSTIIYDSGDVTDALQSALSNYSIVYYYGDSSVPTNATISTLTVPNGKTLYIGDGTNGIFPMISGTLTNDGTVTIQTDSMLNVGNSPSATGASFVNNGTLNINGGIYNDGTFENNGVVNNYSSM